MLRQVLAEIENAVGAVRLEDIAQRLQLDRSVVEDMVDYWVRKGRLLADQGAACASAAGPGACTGCSVLGVCSTPLKLIVPTMPRRAPAG